MSVLEIRRDRYHERWIVMRRGEFARVITSFDSLAAAEAYVIEHGDPIPEVQT